MQVDAVSKKHLIMMLYDVFRGYDRSKMHEIAKNFQDFLQKKYGITLGYLFEDGGKRSIYDIWDVEFQRDVERYDALGKVISEAGEERVKGAYLLRTDVPDNLERQFGESFFGETMEFLKEMKENTPNIGGLSKYEDNTVFAGGKPS